MKPWDIVAWYSDNVAKRKLSKAEIGRILGQIKNLNKDYSLEDIMYALVWTSQHKKNMHHFGYVLYTIEEALEEKHKLEAARERIAQLAANPDVPPSVPVTESTAVRPKPRWMRGEPDVSS